MLVVKINSDKDEKLMAHVIMALEGLDIESISWETEKIDPGTKIRSGETDPGDLGQAVSAAVDSFRRHG